MEKKNFYYDEKTFDTAKNISTYGDVAKVSGSALSEGTKLIASKLATSGTKLTITYILKNGNESSDKQTFTYPGFIAKGDSRVTILKVTTIPINAVSSSNKSPVDIATLVTEDQAKNDIATKHLKYTIVSATKASIDVKDNFEIINSTLKLKALQELTIGSVEFIISVKLKSGDSLTIRSAPFIVTIKAKPIEAVKIKSITGTTPSAISAVSSSNKSPIEIATLATIDKSDNPIAAELLNYKITSAIKSGGGDIKTHFLITNDGKLKLKENQALTIGTIHFVVSAVLKSGDATTKYSKPFILTIN